MWEWQPDRQTFTWRSTESATPEDMLRRRIESFKDAARASFNDFEPFLNLSIERAGGQMVSRAGAAALADVALSPLFAGGAPVRLFSQLLLGNIAATNFFTLFINAIRRLVKKEPLNYWSMKSIYNYVRKANQKRAAAVASYLEKIKGTPTQAQREEAKKAGEAAVAAFRKEMGGGFEGAFRKVVFVADKSMSLVMLKAHWLLVLYARFWRPICGLDAKDAYAVMSSATMGTVEFLSAGFIKYKPDTNKYEKIEKQLGIDVIKRQYPVDADFLFASCKKMRDAVKADRDFVGESIDKMKKNLLNLFYTVGVEAAQISREATEQALNSETAQQARQDLKTNYSKGVRLANELTAAVAGDPEARESLCKPWYRIR